VEEIPGNPPLRQPNPAPAFTAPGAPEPPAPPGEDPRPIRLVIVDPALERSRLTVLVRLVLAIPLLVWLGLWTFVTLFVGIVTWFVVLFKAELPASLQDYFSSYVRFTAHVNAYLSFAANRYPSFVGKPGYAIDVEIDPPPRHRRWTAALRLVLALPALLLSTTLAGSVPLPSSGASATTWGLSLQGGGALFVVGVLGWFVCLVRGRMAAGMRDLAAYAIGYGVQVTGYVFFLTDRYPSADPRCLLPTLRIPHHPVRLENGDDPRRSRLLVLLRLPLVFPHIVWLSLWSAIVYAIAPIVWLIVLILGRLPRPLHRFLAAWARAIGQLTAFATLVGGPFPGFVGASGYPVDLPIDPPAPQHRAVTAFRLLLAIPSWLLASVYSSALAAIAVLLWLAGLATGKAPAGLQALGAAGVRYLVQALAYTFLLTDRYPYSSPGLDVREQARDEPSELIQPSSFPA